MTSPDSHLALVRAHLETGAPITPMEALELFGCFRLGARIYELKKEGLTIETERDPVKRFAIYRITKEGNA